MLLIKAAIVVALLYFLAQKGFISLKDTQRAFSRWDKLGPAATVMLICMFLGALRWQWLLRAQGIHLKFLRTLELTMIGNFFNIALPGAVSGDFVKAFYIGKEIHGQRARAFGSILFDRVAGLSALSFVSAGALLLGFESFRGQVVFVALRYLITFAALGSIAFYAYLFLVRERHDPLFRFFGLLERRIPKMGSIKRIYEGLRHYHHHRIVVLKILLLSVVVHLAVGWTCMQFAQALGESQVGLLPIYVVVPLGLLVTAIPVMPAGVGTGHAAFLYLFHLIGSERGADIFTLWALFNLGLGALGGLVYLRFRTHEPKPVPDFDGAPSSEAP